MDYKCNFKLALALVLSLLILMTGTAFAQPSDTEGHWAEQEISTWTTAGFAKGYSDGSFKPGNNITRAEFVTLVNRSFMLTQKADLDFADVSGSEWYAKEVAKAKAAGYVSGYEDGTFKPNQKISRQEAASMLARLLDLDLTGQDAVGAFGDAGDIPQWSKGVVNAVVSAGYMTGYPDETFKATRFITRAESLVTLYRAAAALTVYTEAGTYGPEEETETIEGNVVITAEGVTLQNLTIIGNLVLAQSIGNGNVTLDSVTVTGKTIVNGGGENSIYIIGNSSLFDVVVDRASGKVRIVAKDNASVANLILSTEAKVQEEGVTGDGFNNVAIEIPENATVEFEGDFGNIDIAAPKAQVKLVKGTFATVNTTDKAEGSTLEVAKEASIVKLGINSSATVTGEGAIKKATIYAEGVKIEQTPEQTEVREGLTAEVGGETIEGGTTTSNLGGGSSGGTSTIRVTAISINKTTMTLTAGGATGTITATVTPVDATNKDITWSSSDTNVATVNSSGVVTPVAAGTSTITATTADGGFTATCTVTVNASLVAVTGITLDQVRMTLTAGGDTGTLTKTIAPADATNKNVTWISSDERVAAVAEGIVTPLAEGTATITVTTEDGNFTATCVVTVNTTPVANDDSAEVDEDSTVLIDVLVNDTDVDGDTLSITSFTQGTYGLVTKEGDSLRYKPNVDFREIDSFEYEIDDGNGGTDRATVNIVVNITSSLTGVYNSNYSENSGMFDVPITIVSEGIFVFKTSQYIELCDTVMYLYDVNGNVIAMNDNYVDSYSTIVKNLGAGDYTIRIVEKSLQPLNTNLSIYIKSSTGANVAPVAADDSATVDEDGTVLINVLTNDTDAQGDTLSVTGFTQGTNGTVAQEGDSLRYTPDANYNGADSFTYDISDGNGGIATATVNVTINPINDLPVATNDAAVLNEDSTVLIDALVNDSDVDGDTLSITGFTQGTNGTVAQEGDSLRYTPDANYNGADSFTYDISDGNGGIATATVNVTINPINDLPVATNDAAVVNEDGTVLIDVLVNDSDVEGDTLSITGFTQGTNGTVAQEGDSLRYTPDANYNGADSFTYDISDGNGGITTATVNITINPINDVPVATNDSATVGEDSFILINVLVNDTDVDGDTLSITGFTQGTNGTVAQEGNSLRYTPDANYNGADSFTYEISDGNGGIATATVNLTVIADVQLASLTEDLTEDISPAFAGSTYGYTLAAANAESNVNITPTLVGATITWDVDTDSIYSATPVASGAAATIPLAVGENVITIHVEKDGTVPRDYTITVTRADLITAAHVNITKAVVGGTPEDTATVEASTYNPDFTVTSVTWNPVYQLTDIGTFKPWAIYRVHLVLTSKDGKEFPAVFTPTVPVDGSGWVQIINTATSGAGVGNTLSFTLEYTTTHRLINVAGVSDGMPQGSGTLANPTIWDIEVLKTSIGLADIEVPEGAIKNLYTNANFTDGEITGSATIPVVEGGVTAYIKVTSEDGIEQYHTVNIIIQPVFDFAITYNSHPSYVVVWCNTGRTVSGNPAPGDFAIGGTHANGRVVTSVRMIGDGIELALSAPLLSGEVITVSYVPGTNPMYDESGEAVPAFSDMPVNNHV